MSKQELKAGGFRHVIDPTYRPTKRDYISFDNEFFEPVVITLFPVEGWTKPVWVYTKTKGV